MASTASTQPAPTPGRDRAPKVWEQPKGDQEFVFESVDKAPGWIDKNWAGFDRGPALQLPRDLTGRGPYSPILARVGDKVRFVAATPSRPAHFIVEEGERKPGSGTKRPPAVTNASLEDMLATGAIGVDDLGEDAKAQVAARSPTMKALVEDGKNAPKALSAEDLGIKV